MANQTSEAHGSVRGDETDPGRLETNGRKHFQQGKRVACSAQFMDLGLFSPSAYLESLSSVFNRIPVNTRFVRRTGLHFKRSPAEFLKVGRPSLFSSFLSRSDRSLVSVSVLESMDRFPLVIG